MNKKETRLNFFKRNIMEDVIVATALNAVPKPINKLLYIVF